MKFTCSTVNAALQHCTITMRANRTAILAITQLLYFKYQLLVDLFDYIECILCSLEYLLQGEES